MKSSPLLFNNEGSMLTYFRAMVSDPDKRSATISFLIDSSKRYHYRSVSIDLEPSCWSASNYTTDCEFPNQIDVSNFKSIINDLAEGLHKSSLGQVGLTVCSGSYPVLQCSGGFEQSKLCVPGYEKLCSNGTLSYDDCNCCAFVTWFDPTMICSSKADVIVNMDTYQSTYDEQEFRNAMRWYTDHGCSQPNRIAVGLLTGQTQNESDTAALFSLVRDIAVWVNIWQDDRTKMLWQSELQAFLSSP